MDKWLKRGDPPCSTQFNCDCSGECRVGFSCCCHLMYCCVKLNAILLDKMIV